ncbi:hypothetical protein [Scardovia wiggsiae]|uniref:hypothetical protein n=1 Tax=Scardovia wiggsiae TaxID=230143 RepID=UPI00374F16EC
MINCPTLFGSKTDQLHVYIGEPGAPIPQIKDLDSNNVPSFKEFTVDKPMLMPAGIELLDGSENSLAKFQAKYQSINHILSILVQGSLLMNLVTTQEKLDACDAHEIPIEFRIRLLKENDLSKQILQTLVKHR